VKGISRTYSEANGDFIRPFSTVEYMREKPTASAGRIVSCKWEVVVPQVFSLSVQEYLPSCLVLAISSSGASYFSKPSATSLSPSDTLTVVSIWIRLL